MKDSMYIKKSIVLCVLLLFSCSLFAQTGTQVASGITTFYSTYIRPILIAWVVIQLAIGGIMANNKIQKDHDQSSEAMIGFFKMAVWPVVVLGIAEVGTALYNHI
jgi:hypothetical protein